MGEDKTEKLKEKLEDEELAQTIEQVIEEKIEQRVQKRQEKEDQNSREKEEISRRSFLKKMGLGAAGLGAASLIPSTSALDIRDSTGLSVHQDSTEYLDVSSTAVNVLNTVLQEQGNRVATRTWVNNNTTSFSGSHDDLSNVSSADHHSKTSSASELSDISPDSTSNAHHSRYSDSEARGAIEAGSVDHVKFSNIEDVSDGQIGRDNSIGFLGSWGGNGTAVLWDSYTVNAGNQINITGGTGPEDHPTIAVNDGGGSGLDADTVDGQDASELGAPSSTQSTGAVSDTRHTFGTPDGGEDFSPRIPVTELYVGDNNTHYNMADGTTIKSGDYSGDWISVDGLLASTANPNYNANTAAGLSWAIIAHSHNL